MPAPCVHVSVAATGVLPNSVAGPAASTRVVPGQAVEDNWMLTARPISERGSVFRRSDARIRLGSRIGTRARTVEYGGNRHGPEGASTAPPTSIPERRGPRAADTPLVGGYLLFIGTPYPSIKYGARIVKRGKYARQYRPPVFGPPVSEEGALCEPPVCHYPFG